MIRDGNYKTGLKKLLLWEIQEDLSPISKLECQLLKAKLMNKLGRNKESLEIAKESINYSKKLNSPLFMIDSLLLKAQALWFLGKIEKSKKAVQLGFKTLKRFPKNDFDVLKRKAFLHIQEGHVAWSLGDLETALKNFEESLSIGTAIEYQECIADSLGNIGVVYVFKGEMIEALEYLHRSLNLFKKTANKISIAEANTNIGGLYQRKGDLDQALIYIETGLNLFKDIGDQFKIASSLGHIGEIYFQKDDLAKALKKFEEAKEIYKSIGNNSYLSRILFSLVRITLYNEEISLAKQYLQEIKIINTKNEPKLIDQRYRLANALILKKTQRIQNLAQAEIVLRKIVSEKVKDHHITVLALTNLCELLLFELKTTSGNLEILNEIQEIINQLLSIANQQNSASLLVETYLLQSKMALLHMNTDFAKKLLTQALEIAETKGLSKLAIAVSNEYDSLLNIIDEYETKTNASIIERLEFIDLENSISNVIDRKISDIPKVREENPILFLVIHENGLCVYSREFQSKLEFNDQLVGGFLTAVNALMGHIFSASSGSIERIKYQDYTLIIKAIEPLLFSYVFTGQSYHAMHKLDRIIAHLQESRDNWDLLANVPTSGVLLSQKENENLNIKIDQLIKKSSEM